jgi:hypothetical protein
MVDIGVEGCVLPVIVESQQILLPCLVPAGYNEFDVGEYAYIDYQPLGCSNVCLLGLEVEITCLNIITGIENQGKESVMNIYPTLADSRVVIEEKDIQRVEFFDTRGLSMMVIENLEAGEIDISGLAAGVYFVRIKTRSATRVVTLIKI